MNCSVPSFTTRRESSDSLPLEITYSILKPFLAGADQGFLELPPYYETDPRNGVSSRSVGVHVRICQPNCRGKGSSPPFEEIEFSLHGVVKSQVGNRIAKKKILHSIELRRWSDFYKHQQGKNIPSRQLGEEYYCDLNFQIDRTCDSHHLMRSPSKMATAAQLLPSMSISGSKYITQSTALNDQHLVSGRCDVIYWIEARFVPSTTFTDVTNDLVQVLRSHTLSLKPSPSRVRLVPPRTLLRRESRRFEVEAKTSDSLRMIRQCQSFFSSTSRQTQSQPRFMFSIQDSLSRNHTLLTTSSSTSTLVIPLTMTVFIPPSNTSSSLESANSSCGALRRRLTGSGFPNTIIVTSTWNTKYKFMTNSTCPPADDDYDEIEKHTMRRESRTVKFPPLYQSTGSQYTATADLEISVPTGLPVTSSASLLTVQHFLSIGIKIGEEESASHSTSSIAVSHAAGMTADMRVECVVEI